MKRLGELVGRLLPSRASTVRVEAHHVQVVALIPTNVMTTVSSAPHEMCSPLTTGGGVTIHSA